MISRTALLCLLFVAQLCGYAQEKKDSPKADQIKLKEKPVEHKFGKVALTEFETKVTGTDSAASAIVLFDIGTGYFDYDNEGMNYIYECHTRFKVINKNGYDYANFQLQLFNSNGSGVSLISMDGATYNLEGGKIVISKIGKDAKFSEKQDKNFTLKKFTLPNVKEGSIIEYRYKIKSDYISRLRPWYFQRAIPTLFSEFNLSVPEYCRYRPNVGGYIYLNPYREEVNGGTFFHYYAHNIPGLKDENFVTTMDDYRSRISFELSSVTIPGRLYEDYTSTWPKLIHTIKEDANFGQFINKTSYSKTLLKTIIKDATEPDTVVQLIFNYVKNNIKWNEDFSLYTSESSPKNIFEKKNGNSADVNLCMYTLLKEAKLNAFPLLLSTRQNGTHPGFPVLGAFDNVIIAVQIGETTTMLDATDKNLSKGLISYQNLNHQGFMMNLDQETGKWVTLENKQISKKNFSCSFTLDDQNKLFGKMYITTTGHEALRRRGEYKSATNEADFLKSYKSDKPGLTIEKYEISNLENANENLIETMDISIEDNVEEAGNLAYFTPMLFERTKENPFKLEERKFPVDFAYATEENYRITVEFPKGYQLEKTPKNEKIMLPDERAAFTFLFAVEENKLMLSSKIAIRSSMYSPEEYKDLKELFMNIVRKQAEQVVFKKN